MMTHTICTFSLYLLLFLEDSSSKRCLDFLSKDYMPSSTSYYCRLISSFVQRSTVLKKKKKKKRNYKIRTCLAFHDFYHQMLGRSRNGL
ncbi:hypothetical protein F4802DRAFT_577387 [Xylaria palmicola]|nr:hypothetical protein F4802DRAFT_577387 [Xylaria palmicola]